MLGRSRLFSYMKSGVFFFKYLLNIENREALTDKNKWLPSDVNLGHHSSPPASQEGSE